MMQPSARIELVCRRALDNRPSAVAALGWYGEARSFALDVAWTNPNLDLQTVAGFIAALSPQNGWEDQLRWTVRQILAAQNGAKIPGPGFSKNKTKARRILNGEHPLGVLSGPKVRAFYVCIVAGGDSTEVCVDRHAWAIASGPDAVGLSLTANRYRATAAAYVAAAAALRVAYPGLADRLTPANVQALAWVWWRDNPESRF